MYYSPSHEWMTLEGNIGTVGITDHAQKELGEIVFVELPKLGETFEMGREICVLESTKAAADVYSPVSGKVVAINKEVKLHPNQINHDAESTGWLFKIELMNNDELEFLLDKEKYLELISG